VGLLAVTGSASGRRPGPFEERLRVHSMFDEEYAECGRIERTGHVPGASPLGVARTEQGMVTAGR